MVSKRDLMTNFRKTSRETINLETAPQNPMQTLRFASANLRSFISRCAEVDMLFRRIVDVAAMQEVWFKNHSISTVKRGEESYKLFYSGTLQT